MKRQLKFALNTRFKATSLEKYKKLVAPRLPPNPNFARIAAFMQKRNWHFGVQLAAPVAEKWGEPSCADTKDFLHSNSYLWVSVFIQVS